MSRSHEQAAGMPEHFPSDAIQQSALSHGIVLDSARLNNLAATFKSNQLYRQIGGKVDRIVDPQNRFRVENIVTTPDSPGYSHGWWSGDESTAMIHFVPDPRSISERIIIHDARPERANQYGHWMIQGLQNYFLLVEAGCMEPRDRLVAEATVHIARPAKKLFGFVVIGTGVGENGEPWERITAPSDSTRDLFFSKRIRDFDDALRARLQDAR